MTIITININEIEKAVKDRIRDANNELAVLLPARPPVSADLAAEVRNFFIDSSVAQQCILTFRVTNKIFQNKLRVLKTRHTNLTSALGNNSITTVHTKGDRQFAIADGLWMAGFLIALTIIHITLNTIEQEKGKLFNKNPTAWWLIYIVRTVFALGIVMGAVMLYLNFPRTTVTPHSALPTPPAAAPTPRTLSTAAAPGA